MVYLVCLVEESRPRMREHGMFTGVLREHQ